MQFINPELAEYRYIETLGNGAQGTVHKVEDASGRRTFALKIFTTAMDVLAKRELAAMEQCNHSNIVQIYGADLEHQESYILMQYMKHGTIEQYVKQHDVSIYEKLLLINDICEALKYMHEKEFVHRDIKPENIFVTDDGGKPYACLGDFGIVKEFGSTTLTKTSGGVGTMLYSPPEVLGGNGKLSYASDVYALGMTLYELAAEKHAYDISNPMTFFQEIMQKEIVRPSSHNRSVFKSLDDLCIKSIHKKKEERYDTINAFMNDLKACIGFCAPEEVNEEKEDEWALVKYVDVLYEEDDESTSVVHTSKVVKTPRDNREIVRLLNLNKDPEFIGTIKGDYDFLLFDTLDNDKDCLAITGYDPEKIIKRTDDTLLGEALYLEGEICYFHGQELYLQNPNELDTYIKIKKCYEQAVILGNVDGLYSLGDIYMRAGSTKMEIESTIPMRDEVTRECLAICLERLFGENKDYYLRAKKYFEQAGKKGHPGALSMAGYLCAKGWGVNQDYQKAKKYFEDGVKKGSTTALANLGVLYCQGFGVRKNVLDGKKYIEQAAAQENLGATMCLGDIKRHGIRGADFCYEFKENDLGRYDRLKDIKKAIWEQYTSK